MSAHIYVGDTKHVVWLGGTLEFLRAFAEIGRLEPGGAYAELHGVTQACDEVVSPDWVSDVSEQAARFLRAHRGELSDHATWILDLLVSGPERPTEGSGLTHGT